MWSVDWLWGVAPKILRLPLRRLLRELPLRQLGLPGQERPERRSSAAAEGWSR